MNAREWISFAAVSVLWGIPYLFIKVAVDDGMPPAFLAWSRVVLAAVVLLVLAWQRGLLGTLRGRLRWVAFYGVVEISIPFPLISAGERHVSSSLAAILIAAVPLIIAVLALRFDESERVDRSRLIGLLVGFAGVIALVGIDVAGDGDELLGALFVLIAAVGYAIGPMTFNAKMPDLQPLAVMAGALTVAAVVLTPFALADVPDTTPSGGALTSIAVLGLLCTALAFVVFGGLLLDVGPARASVITYVAPVVAVALGVVALGERPGPGAAVGLVLILAGCWLSTARAKSRPATEPVT